MSADEQQREPQTDKELARAAWLAAWNEKGTMPHLTPLEKRTAINHFETWYQGHDEGDNA